MRTLLPLGLALALVGCGWSRGLVLPEGAATVGVEIFRTERGVYERGLEADLHRALTRAVSDLVQAPLVAPERADVVLRGAIEGYRRRSGIRNRDNELLETALELRIRAELVPRRGAGRDPAAEPPAAHQARVWSGYALDAPGNELGARERALRYLAEEIVLELFAAEPAAPVPQEEGAIRAEPL